MKKSNPSEASKKDKDWRKPYDNFPLCYHRWSGRLYRKIRGTRYYFGHIRDWRAAVEKFERDSDALYAGRKPREQGDGLTIRDLCNRFLTSKQRLLDSGELSPRTFQDYRATTDRIYDYFQRSRLVADLDGDDFDEFRASIAKSCGPVRLANEIQRVRTVMKYAHDQGYISQPVRFGSTFKRPSQKVMRKHKAAKGKRTLESHELRACIEASSGQMKAIILVAANAALGQSDISEMNLDVLDLDGGMLNFPRPKTGIERRCPLWEETVTAILEWLPMRPAAKDPADANAVFLTHHGRRWVRTNQGTGTPADALGRQFARLLSELKIKRAGVSFYAIRHTWRTVADEKLDSRATDLIMGHSDPSMGARYVESISDDRLRKVTDYVRRWLFDIADEVGKESTEARGGLRVVG